MAATNIDEVFAQIEKDFVELSKTAARNAATGTRSAPPPCCLYPRLTAERI